MRAFTVTMALGLVLAAGVARAHNDSECMRDAKEQRGQCHTSCDEDFVVARDLCRNIDPECAAGCRVALEECRAPIVAQLQACVDVCRDRLNTERGACPKKGRGRDFCVDRAQVRSFLCRDECRENLQVRAGLRSCRESFMVCMAGCSTQPTPVPTKTAAPPVPTAVKTEPPHPTPVKTESPQATAKRTETPPEPTAVRTEPPPPTMTPVPTEVPEPTETPVPTETPIRTATPRPTNTFTGPR